MQTFFLLFFHIPQRQKKTFFLFAKIMEREKSETFPFIVSNVPHTFADHKLGIQNVKIFFEYFLPVFFFLKF